VPDRSMSSLRLVTLIAGLSVLGGCMGLRPTPVPLRTIDLKSAGESPARCLVVLLPGRRDRPEDFARFDIPGLAARAGEAVDMIAVDAHLGYYHDRTVVDRLREDVIGPARERYEQVWLAGISLGGTGSLLYAIEHPEDVDGLVLLAPFLGEDEVISEVRAAGGLRGWQPSGELDPEDFQRRLWAWLERYENGSRGNIPLYLGYGARDGFAPANALLASVLPPGRVFTVDGGHDWPAWRALWEGFVRTGALCGPPE
jgi:Serine aminopeptidase, S33